MHPVNSARDLFDDPHLRETQSWASLDAGAFGTLQLPVPPLRFDGRDLPIGSVPVPGQHNR